VPGRFEFLALKDLEKLRRLREPCSRRRGRPAPGVMHRHMPASSAPQGKAAHDQALLVDGIMTLGVRERLERIRFPRKLVPVTEPSVAVEDKRIAWREFAGGCFPPLDKSEFGQVFSPAMKP